MPIKSYKSLIILSKLQNKVLKKPENGERSLTDNLNDTKSKIIKYSLPLVTEYQLVIYTFNVCETVL